VIEVDEKGDVSILDLGSISGTIVNGKRVTRANLKSGDEILLGETKIKILEEEEEEKEKGAVVPPPIVPPPITPSKEAPAELKPEMPVPKPASMEKSEAPALDAFAPVEAAQYYPPVETMVDIDKIEDRTGAHIIEVIPIWQNSALDAKHFLEPRSYYIGEDPECDFFIPSERVPSPKFPLVFTDGASSSLMIPPNAEGDVTIGEERIDLKELISRGQAVQSSEYPGVYRYSIPAGARCKIDIGTVSFLVNSVPPPRQFKGPLAFDWHSQLYTVFSLIAHAAFLFLVYFIPPEPKTLSIDLLALENRFVKYIIQPPEIQQEEIPEWLKRSDEGEEMGGKGKRHKGEEGMMGDPKAKKTDSHYGIKGPKDNPDPHMARTRAREMAKTAGILGIIAVAPGAVNAPTSPFGRDTALGNDPENALGALMGNQVGENFGYGGLGLRGTGRGGGGTGEGTIGLGNLGTIGHGAGGGSGSGYGRGAGGLRGRRARAPRIHTGSAVVMGALSKEVIRRIVRRHMNEIKFCYEQQLAIQPDLRGRVAVKFVISPQGSVSSSVVASTTLHNARVENCIVKAVRRWVFPAPEGGGIVIVTYPFMLEPAGTN
jgi:TonB family protein